MNKTLKRIVVISILSAFAICLSAFDNLISHGVFGIFKTTIPGLKIGLANIVILVAIYRFKIKESFFIALLKSIVVAIMFSGMTSFIIGATGTFLSFVVMEILNKMLKNDKYIVFVSAVGAITHIIGQIVSAFIFYGLTDIKAFILYSPLLIAISIVSGIIMGLVSKQGLKILDNTKIVK